jgi:hypothetical protein
VNGYEPQSVTKSSVQSIPHQKTNGSEEEEEEEEEGNKTVSPSCPLEARIISGQSLRRD